MIPKKYLSLTMSAILSIIMSLMMSGIVTAINTGLEQGFVGRWLGAFALVLPLAFVGIQFLAPLARAIAGALTAKT